MITEFNNLNGNIGVSITGIKDRNVESIIIPETIDGYPVTEISGEALGWLNSLECLTIPPSVSVMGTETLHGSTNIKVINGEFIEDNFIVINNRFIFNCVYVHNIEYQVCGDYVISYGVHLGYFFDKIEYNRNFRIWQLIMWIIKKIYRCHGEI